MEVDWQLSTFARMWRAELNWSGTRSTARSACGNSDQVTWVWIRAAKSRSLISWAGSVEQGRRRAEQSSKWYRFMAVAECSGKIYQSET